MGGWGRGVGGWGRGVGTAGRVGEGLKSPVPSQSSASALPPREPGRTRCKRLREKTPNPTEPPQPGRGCWCSPRRARSRTVGRRWPETHSSILGHQHGVQTQVGCGGRAGQGPRGPAEPRSGRGSPPLRMQPSRGPGQGGCWGAGAAERAGTEERARPLSAAGEGPRGRLGAGPPYPQPRLTGQGMPDRSNCPVHHVPEPQWGQRPSLCQIGRAHV